mmetsp:Transcript_168151/g.540133  ORF Transcript_168151/g.540133 Transcript_168151/m.540133 type:complete len:646 (-) Transcript_168151:69-2006(-)
MDRLSPLRHGIFLYQNGDVYVGQWTSSAGAEVASSFQLLPTMAMPGGPSAACLAKGRCRAPLDDGIRPSPSPQDSCDSDGVNIGIEELGSEDDGTSCGTSAFLSRPVLCRGLAPCREGWGVYLKGQEKYEGEWHKDARHGLGTLIGRRASDRYVGRFQEGARAGGLSISRQGELYVEIWEIGKLIRRDLLFSAFGKGCVESLEHTGASSEASSRSSSCSSNSRVPSSSSASSRGTLRASGEGTAPIGNGDAEALSNLRAIEDWSPSQVARLVRCIGVSALIAARLREHSVDGRALGTLALRSAKPFLRQLFEGDAADDLGGKGASERRLLLLAVEMFLKFRHRLSAPEVSVERVREQFCDLEIGEGQLAFDKMVGEGGYGHVYRARWMHAEVAAKAFRGGNTGLLSRDFFTELSVLRRLRHPNITLLVGFCFQPRYIIVTEFVPGGSLFDLLHGKQRPLDLHLSKVVSIAREICVGMVYLHVNNIVHCDLKSSNVLLNGPQEVKICDFGLSRLLGEGPSLQEQAGITIGCVGTHHWMAPEVLRGEEYSKASDVYSFGMIFWEMISRKVPFHGYTATQVTGLVGYGRCKPQLPKGCPVPLKGLLKKALRPRPSQRRDFHGLAEALGRLHRSAIIEVEESLWMFFSG